MAGTPRPQAVPEAADVPRFVLEHADFVWRSVRRLGVPEAMADDATQQVFVTVQTKMHAILVGRERAFLFGVAINVAAHVRRSLARRREVYEERAVDIADDAPLPDEALDQHRARALLDAVLDAMELDLRTVFVMIELEEMTMAEIAEVLAVPPGTVASRLRRARAEFQKHAQRLRARLEGRTMLAAPFSQTPSSTKLEAAGEGNPR